MSYLCTIIQNNHTMKKHLSLLLLLMVPVVVFAQKDDSEYENYKKKFHAFLDENKSTEKDEYYKNRKFKEFEPLSKEIVSDYYDDFFKFVEVDDFTPYNDTLYFTPYQDSVFHSPTFFEDYPKIDYYASINKHSILKQEKKRNIEAFIYESGEFENMFFGEPGIWVAYSNDNGETWSYYYTGIVQRQPLFVKWYSSYPLINEQGDLQIEACLLRQTSLFIHPGPGPSYQLAKDGLLLTLDLETLRKDSDGDGLTDIVEAKFRTDPKNADTDGDGVPDNLDLNPRFASQRTDKSVIYEAVLNEVQIPFWSEKEEETILPIDATPETHYAVDTTETILIVTDDPALQNIQPKSYRVIVLTTEEYENNPRYFENDLNDISFTPLFKVDGKKDTYLFSFNFNTWGASYWVKKTDKGWIIVMTSQWIS